ncbi:dienelactone hydrolase family protein [Mycolicibacterium neoaurum]|uniref:Dienelactone hydrolase n=1 Tax=Mycolicibacterium neoaurum TaxID=1795 RepID=A0AAV2WH13_MYCNE|nr:dienelactone hydrolase family protein [Mycolicibacterium neoaurum]TLH59774.1 dienelactone hydrolase family protein [Mycolicibacterium neoaurum]CDQ43013.1 dienelactone hydrolase [Mycolicibacterium neoaurum]
MSTITLETPEGTIDALVGTPAGTGPWPGVVIVHDAIGYGPDKEAVSERVAAAGYLAVTPNLYSRGGRARCITSVMRAALTRQGPPIDDIMAARRYLVDRTDCTGTVGIAGFCMGGQFALILSPRGFAAAAPFYGTPLPKNLADTLRGACPIVASFGAKDPLGRGAPAALNRAVADEQIDADIKVYPDAGHSFANQLPAQALLRVTGFGYNDAVAEDAWKRVFTFFDAHLRG